MSDILVWRVRNERTFRSEVLRVPADQMPNTRVFEWEGEMYRRDALLDVDHGQRVRGSEKGPDVLVQRDIEDVVGWQYDQFDPAFDKHDTNPDSPSYGQPVFGSRDDVRRGLRNLKERGQEASYGDGLSRIRP